VTSCGPCRAAAAGAVADLTNLARLTQTEPAGEAVHLEARAPGASFCFLAPLAGGEHSLAAPQDGMTSTDLDLHLLFCAAESLDAATADLALLADLADEPALLTDVLVLLDALDREAAALAAVIARHRSL
jgi:hypothetical protein